MGARGSLSMQSRIQNFQQETVTRQAKNWIRQSKATKEIHSSCPCLSPADIGIRHDPIRDSTGVDHKKLSLSSPVPHRIPTATMAT